MSEKMLGDRYIIGQLIGRGGMADVYAATDTLLGRDVAIKMMRADLARDPSFLERFRREAKNAAKLNHSTIVAVYDTGETPEAEGSVPYIVMERVHGDTLRDILREQGKLPVAAASRIMSQVAQALNFSHETGIIHRDIKPANIMVTNTGGVKVMDFGIARAVTDTSSAMTQTATVIGTAQYLSPEQAQGHSADARSDIYAAGCVFYEAITGTPPFGGDTPFAVAFQHVHSDPPLPSELLDTSPTEGQNIDAVVTTAMAKDPSDRYLTAQQFSQDLERLGQGLFPLFAKAPHISGQGQAVDTTETRISRAIVPAVGTNQHPATEVIEAYEGDSVPPINTTYDEAEYDYEPETGQTQAVGQPGNRKRRLFPILLALALLGVAGIAGYTYFFAGNALMSQVSIPDVAGKSEQQARQILDDAGLQYDTQYDPHPNIERDHAIGTNPAANSRVQKDSRITLLLSAGKEITSIPDLHGVTTEDADRLLSDAGLILDPVVKENSDPELEAGKIIESNPRAGTEVPKGTQITITVSTGPEEARVPTVTGQSISAARANLEGAGFKVDIEMVDSPEPADKVLSVTDEGNMHPKSVPLKVQVSKGNQFFMPNLVGSNATGAQRALQNAGWNGRPDQLSRHDVRTVNLLQQGTIAEQSIPPGTPVNNDSSIDIGVFAFAV